MIWALAAALIFALLAAPFVAERFRREMDDAARTPAPGSFARLPGGVTHYRWHGPKGGPVLVCIHGLTTPSHVWDALLPALSKTGFRVLTYDLFGRGFSDRPGGHQDRAFFIGQLRDLLADQGVDGPVTLLGYSMGGSIATVFAASEPVCVARVVLLAPAGMGHDLGRLAYLAQRLPGLGDWLMRAVGAWHLCRIATAQDGPPALIRAMAERQRTETRRRGYLPAVLSSQRHLLAETLETEHRALAARGVPVAAIWGADDAVIPVASMGRLAEWNRNARQAVIAGAGHGLAYTHPVEVTEALADMLG